MLGKVRAREGRSQTSRLQLSGGRSFDGGRQCKDSPASLRVPLAGDVQLFAQILIKHFGEHFANDEYHSYSLPETRSLANFRNKTILFWSAVDPHRPWQRIFYWPKPLLFADCARVECPAP